MITGTLAGDNRLELLLFGLGGRQRFGINVLKIREITPCSELTHIPHSHPAVMGIAHLRGETLSVIDLARAVGKASPFSEESGPEGSIIITEFYRTIQGFLVTDIDRIVVCDWREVLPPPQGSGINHYLSGVARVGDTLVQILDIEMVINKVIPSSLIEGETPVHVNTKLQGRRVLLVDDSGVARKRTLQLLEPLGLSVTLANDGKAALELLKNSPPGQGYDMVISDIEMPKMDGYSLTQHIREEAGLSSLYVLLHTSLSGDVNDDKARAVGADDILTKFVPEEIYKAVIQGLNSEHPS